ncbi:hypothetical protein FPV67DRAFT_1484814, partial [Lyophyllum atratum]
SPSTSDVSPILVETTTQTTNIISGPSMTSLPTSDLLPILVETTTQTTNIISGPSATALTFSECIDKIAAQCGSEAADAWLQDSRRLITFQDKCSRLVQAADDRTLRPAWLETDPHQSCYTMTTPRLPLNTKRYWNMMRDHLSSFIADQYGLRNIKIELDGESFKISILFSAGGSARDQTTDDLPIFPARAPLPAELEPADAPPPTFLAASHLNTSENAQHRPHVTAATNSLVQDASDSNDTTRVSADSLASPAWQPCGSCPCCSSASASSLITHDPSIIVPFGHSISISIGPYISYVVTKSQPSALSSLDEARCRVSIIQAAPDNPSPLPGGIVHTVSFPPRGGRRCGRCVCCSNLTASAPPAAGCEGFHVVAPPGYQVSTGWDPTLSVTVSCPEIYAPETSKVESTNEETPKVESMDEEALEVESIKEETPKVESIKEETPKAESIEEETSEVESINDTIPNGACALASLSFFVWLLLFGTCTAACMSRAFLKDTLATNTTVIHNIRQLLPLLSFDTFGALFKYDVR